MKKKGNKKKMCFHKDLESTKNSLSIKGKGKVEQVNCRTCGEVLFRIKGKILTVSEFFRSNGITITRVETMEMDTGTTPQLEETLKELHKDFYSFNPKRKEKDETN